MRFNVIIIGIAIMLISGIGYELSQTLADATQKLIAGYMSAITPSVSGSSPPLSQFQLGYVDAQMFARIIQYGFISLIICGVFVIVFGIFAKKITPQFSNLSLINMGDKSANGDEVLKMNIHGINILKERLAKGDITEKEYERLQKFFE